MSPQCKLWQNAKNDICSHCYEFQSVGFEDFALFHVILIIITAGAELQGHCHLLHGEAKRFCLC